MISEDLLLLPCPLQPTDACYSYYQSFLMGAVDWSEDPGAFAPTPGDGLDDLLGGLASGVSTVEQAISATLGGIVSDPAGAAAGALLGGGYGPDPANAPDQQPSTPGDYFIGEVPI
jgi:hypothetical protein